MASEIKANKISPATGTALTIGDSGDTVSITGTVSTTGNSTNTGNLDVTGDLTVDTDTLYVDSANNRVGIGTSSPSSWSTLAALDSNATGFAGITAINSNANVGIGGIQFASDTTYTKAAIGLLRQNANGNGSIVFYNDSNADASNWTTSDEKMRIDSSGNVLIGTTNLNPIASNTSGITTSPVGFLNVQRSAGTSGSMAVGNNTTGGLIYFYYTASGSPVSTGNISITGTTTSYNTSSDYRLKENVQPLTGGIDRLKQLKPSHWTWIQNGEYGEGFVAHETATVVPEAVTGEKDAMREEDYEVTPAVFDDEGVQTTAAVMGTREVPEYQGIDQSKLVPLLTAALQEAVAKIESLEARVAALEAN